MKRKKIAILDYLYLNTFKCDMISYRKKIAFVVVFPFQMECNADNIDIYIYKDQDTVEEVMVG